MERDPRPAIQLYSVRDMSDSLPDVIRRAADAGFEGVEFATRLRSADPEAVADALDETGVVPVAAHADLSTIDAALAGEADLLERLETVGCDRLIVPHVSSREMQTRSAVRDLSYRLADIAHELDSHDVDLGYHNSRHDLYPMLPGIVGTAFDETPVPQGIANYGVQALARLRRADPRFDPTEIPSKSGFWNLLARTTPDDLFFELDVGGVTAAGFDPGAAIELAAGRLPLVHVSDVVPTGRFGTYEDAYPGEGVVDYASVARAVRDSDVEWFVYEHDDPEDPERVLSNGPDFLSTLRDSVSTTDESTASAERQQASS